MMPALDADAAREFLEGLCDTLNRMPQVIAQCDHCADFVVFADAATVRNEDGRELLVCRTCARLDWTAERDPE